VRHGSCGDSRLRLSREGEAKRPHHGPCGDGRLARPAEAKRGGTRPTAESLSFPRGAQRQGEICCVPAL